MLIGVRDRLLPPGVVIDRSGRMVQGIRAGLRAPQVVKGRAGHPAQRVLAAGHLPRIVIDRRGDLRRRAIGQPHRGADSRIRNTDGAAQHDPAQAVVDRGGHPPRFVHTGNPLAVQVIRAYS